MSFWCDCRVDTKYGDPLRVAPPASVETGVVLPKQPMSCIRMGVEQFLPNDLAQHYPNVDVFECAACGRRMVRG